MKPNITEFDNPSVMSAVNAVLLAKVYVATLRERIEPLQLKLLRDLAVVDQDNGNAITKMSDLYLVTDELAQPVYAEYANRLIAAGGFGIDIAKIRDGSCPLLMAEHLQIKAENNLLDMIGPKLGIEHPHSLATDKRRKLIDMTLTLVVNFPSYKKPDLAL